MFIAGGYHDVPNEKYHGDTRSISHSGLRNLAKSPFHFYSRHLDPNRPPPVEKASQLEGTLAHCATLEPLQFSKRYVTGPDVRANTNEWKAFVALHNDKQVIKPDQYDTARAQAMSVRSLPDVAELLSRGQPEVSVYWNEDVVDQMFPAHEGGDMLNCVQCHNDVGHAGRRRGSVGDYQRDE